MSAPLPRVDADSAGFWVAARTGGLSLARCSTCRLWQQPPAELCRACAAPLAFEPVSGRGTVFSYIVVRHAAVPGHDVPYVVALVELEEQTGLRLSGVVRDAVDRVQVGDAVEVRMVGLGDSDLCGPEFALRVPD